MSLPSTAFILKNGNIVASAMINIGWYVTPEGLINCCYDAYNVCLEAEQQEIKEIPTRPIATIISDWKNFDHMLLYEHIIPRHTLDEYFIGEITKDEFIQRIIDGSYKRAGNRWINHNKLIFTDFQNKVDKKYGNKMGF